MTQTRSYRVVLLIAALMLVVSSFASANRMAPSAVDTPQMAAFVAMGGSLDDLCGDDAVAHMGECPFCNVTADVRSVRPAGQAWRLVPNGADVALRALTLGDQGDRNAWSARGPPQAA